MLRWFYLYAASVPAMLAALLFGIAAAGFTAGGPPGPQAGTDVRADGAPTGGGATAGPSQEEGDDGVIEEDGSRGWSNLAVYALLFAGAVAVIMTVSVAAVYLRRNRRTPR